MIWDKKRVLHDESIQAEIESEDTEVERFSVSRSTRGRRIKSLSRNSSASELPEPESSCFEVDEAVSKPKSHYMRISTAIESTTAQPKQRENSSSGNCSYRGQAKIANQGCQDPDCI